MHALETIRVRNEARDQLARKAHDDLKAARKLLALDPSGDNVARFEKAIREAERF